MNTRVYLVGSQPYHIHQSLGAERMIVLVEADDKAKNDAAPSFRIMYTRYRGYYMTAPTDCFCRRSVVLAQLVERLPSKQNVAGPSPVFR